MTKKHFQLLAEALLTVKKAHYTIPEHQDVFDVVVTAIADMGEASNGRFDRDRFFKVIYHAEM